MSDETAKLDIEKIYKLVAETQKWATGDVTIQDIAEENKALIHELSDYTLSSAVSVLASLLTLPEHQSNCIRLEILVALAVVHCNGKKKAQLTQARQWFKRIGESHCVIGEDPAEDVFVSLVQDKQGDYRLLGGVWEGVGFNTQLFVDVIGTMPDEGVYKQIKESVHALLVISDIVCERAGLHRYQLGSENQQNILSINKVLKRDSLVSRVTIDLADLKEYGIKFTDIIPFILQPIMRCALNNQKIGASNLDRYPLIMESNTQFVVALPSSLTIAIRSFVIEHVLDNDALVEVFDSILANKYAQHHRETPLLGGAMHAPIYWRKSGGHRWASFCSEIDEGFYISFHHFLLSIKTYIDGGFKGVYLVDDALHKAVQGSINESIAHLADKPGFKAGLVVLVGCSWGKSYVTRRFKLNHPNWRFQIITADDLIRLSWLDEMSPEYLWRIQDGLDAVNEAGVQIENLSGILNLIGWVRSNDGHFIPNDSFPDCEVSSEKPLQIIPPTDLTRDIRATTDKRFDRHCSLDNTGKWHYVQRLFSNPLFHNESNHRVYASVNDLLSQTMTSVYESANNQLWISVSAPNIKNKDIQVRLFKMANEWMHRIGNALDVHAKSATASPILKVYIKFCDADPPEFARENPKSKTLESLCKIELCAESNACIAVFEVGFLDGFLIAENIAERLFVRNISRAFLHLLGEKNDSHEAKLIEDQIVLNNEARNFHLFRAQEFIDYVRDTLPNKLVTFDTVNDAAARTGLGWRIRERGQGSRIQGKKTCTKFLAEIVDLLVDDVVALLGRFDRLSTLKRLVGNCEKAYAESDHWNRTSASLLSMHGSDSKSINQIVEQLSKFAGASITTRVLIEIALCTCPLERGSKLSDIEMSKLMARVALIVHFGGLSDAIHYNVIAPEIRISPLGNILFRDEFGELVVKPMLSQVIGDQYIESTPFQKKNYEDPKIFPHTEDIVGDEFWEIWTNEMGFTLDEARNVIDALEDKAIGEHTVILEIRQSEFFALVCSSTKISRKIAKRFLNQFSLETRANWKKPPKNFAVKDIYPWRFRRRLSFITRPILKIDQSEDPLLIIAPHALRTGFVYVIGNYIQ